VDERQGMIQRYFLSGAMVRNYLSDGPLVICCKFDFICAGSKRGMSSLLTFLLASVLLYAINISTHFIQQVLDVVEYRV